jgi:hypothetical protein
MNQDTKAIAWGLGFIFFVALLVTWGLFWYYRGAKLAYDDAEQQLASRNRLLQFSDN